MNREFDEIDEFDDSITSNDFDDEHDEIYAEDDEEQDDTGYEGEEKKYSLDGEIVSTSYYLFSHLPINAKASTDEMVEIMDIYRNSDDPEKVDEAAAKMCGILHSYIISLLNQSYSTYLVKYRDDLICSAYVGVMKGMEKFDPQKGRATTWFKPFIRHECESFINTQVSHASAHYANAAKKVNEVIERKDAEHISYTKTDLYVETGVPVKTIDSVMKIRNVRMTPISQEAGDYDIPTEFGNPVNISEQNESYTSLYKCIMEKLNEKERIVICYKFGIGGMEELTGKEISKRYGIPANQISSIQKGALHKLKKYMTKTEKDKVKEGSIPIGQLLFGDKADEVIKKLQNGMWI